jgi:hypothetical protein
LFGVLFETFQFGQASLLNFLPCCSQVRGLWYIHSLVESNDGFRFGLWGCFALPRCRSQVAFVFVLAYFVGGLRVPPWVCSRSSSPMAGPPAMTIRLVWSPFKTQPHDNWHDNSATEMRWGSQPVFVFRVV